MFENMEMYQEILNNIVARSNGDYITMSYSEKLMVITIMREYKKAIDKFLKTQYYHIKSWAELDLEDVKLEETEPDTKRFDENFAIEFNKLMNNI